MSFFNHHAQIEGKSSVDLLTFMNKNTDEIPFLQSRSVISQLVWRKRKLRSFFEYDSLPFEIELKKEF